MLADHGGELLAEGLLPRTQPAIVVLTELDNEVVGHQDLALPDDRFLVIGLALQGARDLDRLHVALEHLGEGALDEPTEPPLEALQDSHEASLPRRRAIVSAQDHGTERHRPKAM